MKDARAVRRRRRFRSRSAKSIRSRVTANLCWDVAISASALRRLARPEIITVRSFRHPNSVTNSNSNWLCFATSADEAHQIAACGCRSPRGEQLSDFNHLGSSALCGTTHERLNRSGPDDTADVSMSLLRDVTSNEAVWYEKNHRPTRPDDGVP